ncbi:MAG: hypothetical protein GY751_04820 [Bacteroidetes bacterium]|nr:hypothetical protein [Bacteroidota bacterium]
METMKEDAIAILNEKLDQLLPQQPPFVFISSILHWEDDAVTTSYLISDECVFLKESVFQPAGLVEFMAQSGAILVGCRHLDVDDGPPIGYIASIRNLEICRLPTIGTELKCSIQVKNEILSSLIIESEVSDGSEAIASGRLQLYLNS